MRPSHRGVAFIRFALLGSCQLDARQEPHFVRKTRFILTRRFPLALRFRLVGECRQKNIRPSSKRFFADNGDRVVISLLSSRNTWAEQTEEKSAQEFLYYIRGAHDPNASLQIIGSFDSGRYGPRHLYHCCTNYNSFVNNWLVVSLTEGPNTVDIEAWTPACDDATRYKETVGAGADCQHQ